MKVDLGLEDTMEQTLAKLIEKDSGDFSSKNKLRLLRMIKVLGSPTVATSLSIAVVVNKPLENLLYRLLGHEGKRDSIADLLHPRRSAIMSAEAEYVSLSENFEVGEHLQDTTFFNFGPWAIVALLGADLRTQDVKRMARRSLLQLAAGLLDIYVLRTTDS